MQFSPGSQSCQVQWLGGRRHAVPSLELGAGGGITARSGGENALEGWRGGKRGSRGGGGDKESWYEVSESFGSLQESRCLGLGVLRGGAWSLRLDPPVYWVGGWGEQRYTPESSRSDLDSESRRSHPRRQDAGVHGFCHLQTGAPSAGRIRG